MDGFERRKLGDGAWALVPRALEREGYLAAFFERSGGVSVGAFGSSNAAFTVGDDPTSVHENRRRAAAAVGLPSFCVPGLIHGTKVAVVAPENAVDGFAGPPVDLADADAVTTTTPNVGLGAFSADCVIAAMAAPGEGQLSLVHAGWRGLAAGILRSAMSVFGRPAEVLVAIGPAIGPCHYDVGEDVVRALEAGCGSAARRERRAGRWYVDLEATTAAVLRELGARTVEGTGLCTACKEERFFSYRRDGRTGRHVALASAARNAAPRADVDAGRLPYRLAG